MMVHCRGRRRSRRHTCAAEDCDCNTSQDSGAELDCDGRSSTNKITCCCLTCCYSSVTCTRSRKTTETSAYITSPVAAFVDDFPSGASAFVASFSAAAFVLMAALLAVVLSSLAVLTVASIVPMVGAADDVQIAQSQVTGHLHRWQQPQPQQQQPQQQQPQQQLQQQQQQQQLQQRGQQRESRRQRRHQQPRPQQQLLQRQEKQQKQSPQLQKRQPQQQYSAAKRRDSNDSLSRQKRKLFRKNREPGILALTASLITGTFSDTKQLFRNVSSAVRESIDEMVQVSADAALTSTAASGSRKNNSSTAGSSADDTTPTAPPKPDPRKLVQMFIKLNGRNYRGLRRLFKSELRSAIRNSPGNVFSFASELLGSIGDGLRPSKLITRGPIVDDNLVTTRRRRRSVP